MFNKLLSLIFISLVEFYRIALSPIFGGACRFNPSCSLYAKQALQKHRPIYALKLIFLRVIKCHPFGKYGFDPVPDTNCEQNRGQNARTR